MSPDDNVMVHLEYLKEKVDKINDKLEKDYITRAEFDPIKKIVYGVVLIVIAGVIRLLLGVIT